MRKPGRYSHTKPMTKWQRNRKRNRWVAAAAAGLFLLFFIPYLNNKVAEFHANGDTFPSLTMTTKPLAQAVTIPNSGTVTTPSGTSTGASTQGTQPFATEPITQPVTTQPSGTTTPPGTATPGATTPPAGTATAESTTTPGETKPVAGETLKADYKLTTGSIIIISYEQPSPGETRFLSVTGADGECSWDISPSGNVLLLNETKDQNLVLIGADLKAVDRSFNTYNYAGTGNLRRDVYNKRDNFIWMRQAKFFTDDLILFESQVALAMKPMYIWSYIPSTNKYKLVDGTRSTTARLLTLTDAGFEVALDDKTVHINTSLEVIP